MLNGARVILLETAGITISHTVQFTKVDVCRLTSASANPVFVGTFAIHQVNALLYSMPAMSVSTLVLRP